MRFEQPSQVNNLEVKVVYQNTDTDLITITNEKLKLILIEHENSYVSANAWQVPLGIFLAILLTLLTANFKSTLGLPADTWQAVFVISLLLSAAWLLKTLFCRRSVLTTEQLMRKIMNKEVE